MGHHVNNVMFFLRIGFYNVIYKLIFLIFFLKFHYLCLQIFYSFKKLLINKNVVNNTQEYHNRNKAISNIIEPLYSCQVIIVYKHQYVANNKKNNPGYHKNYQSRETSGMDQPAV